MSETKRQNLKKLQFRAKLPKYFRAGAAAALALTVLIIGIGFYFGRQPEFRMKGLNELELSKDVVAEVNNYERRETDDGVLKYYIRADKATTFTDNHQELENIFLQVFDETGEKSDIITAEKAIYVPAENKNFTAFLAGNVNIESRDNLKVKTDQLTYKKETEIAEAEEYIEFERENITGNAVGAVVFVKDKRIELLKDVEIKAFAVNQTDELAQNNIQSAKFTSNYAMFDQTAGKIELKGDVFINVIPTGENAEVSQPTDIRANQATAFFTGREIKQVELSGNVRVSQKPANSNSKWTNTSANRAKIKIDKELKSLELFENVEIETTLNSAKPTKINTQYALYQKDSDRFELKNGVQIATSQDGKAANIKANDAVYEQSNGKIFLTGNAEIAQAGEFIKADNLSAVLYPDKKLKYALAKGNAYLKQTNADRTTEIYAPQLDALFNENQQLQKANTLGESNVKVIPAQSAEYSQLTLSAPKAIRLDFQGEGLLREMQTEGRTTINLNAPNRNANSANKRLTADSIKTVLQADGKNLAKAVADGNAELFVEPLTASAENYKTTINAPRFDCDFYASGNIAKNCTAATKTKTVREPTVKTENRGTQTLLADSLNAFFNGQTQDIEKLEANGNTKFSELDRNGIAGQISYSSGDQIVKLRGGEPTVWDSRARAKAAQIDWDTRNDKSFLSGGAATTYYNQKQTGGATPFTNVNSPVFLTADAAAFDHQKETALYSGNARAWQENNYVRADKLLLEQKQGRLFAEGTVQSSIYDVKRKENGKESSIPVYASANRMIYNRENRSLRYEGAVDIRQGKDRITAETADILMDAKNEVSRTVAEKNVVVTQPNRRASGDWAQYTAANEEVILRGSPARIEDSEQGSSQGAQVTVFLRENRVINEGKTQTNSGRVRSVYKIKKNE